MEIVVGAACTGADLNTDTFKERERGRERENE